MSGEPFDENPPGVQDGVPVLDGEALFSDLEQSPQLASDRLDPLTARTAPVAAHELPTLLAQAAEESKEPVGQSPSGVASAPPQATFLPSPPAAGLSTVANILFSIFAMALLGSGILYFVAGDTIESDRVARMGFDGSEPFEGVRLISMRSVLYPNQDGDDLLVLSGKAQNEGGTPKEKIDVVAEIRRGDGKVVRSERAPLGVILEPPEIASIVEQDAVDLAFAAKMKDGKVAIGPGAPAGFTVIVHDPPQPVENFYHVVLLAFGKTRVLPPAPPPEPEPEAIEEPPRKGKRKGRKGKRKGRKGKRKGRSKVIEAGEP